MIFSSFHERRSFVVRLSVCKRFVHAKSLLLPDNINKKRTTRTRTPTRTITAAAAAAATTSTTTTTRWAGQSPTWGRPSPQVRVESQCSYSKFLSQQWQLSSNSKNCIAFYRRTTWHMDLRQLTVYEHFRWVNAITFFCGPKFITHLVVRIPPLAPKWGTNTLNFRPNFKFSRSKVFFFLGGGSSPFWCALTRLGQSLARMKIWGGSTP